MGKSQSLVDLGLPQVQNNLTINCGNREIVKAEIKDLHGLEALINNVYVWKINTFPP